jgi:hypothetical protein
MTKISGKLLRFSLIRRKFSESHQHSYAINPKTGEAERITVTKTAEPIEGKPNIEEEETGGLQRAKERTGDFMDEAKKTFKGMGESIQNKGHEIKEFFMEKEKDIMSKIRKPESQMEHEEAMEKCNSTCLI